MKTKLSLIYLLFCSLVSAQPWDGQGFVSASIVRDFQRNFYIRLNRTYESEDPAYKLPGKIYKFHVSGRLLWERDAEKNGKLRVLDNSVFREEQKDLVRLLPTKGEDAEKIRLPHYYYPNAFIIKNGVGILTVEDTGYYGIEVTLYDSKLKEIWTRFIGNLERDSETRLGANPTRKEVLLFLRTAQSQEKFKLSKLDVAGSTVWSRDFMEEKNHYYSYSPPVLTREGGVFFAYDRSVEGIAQHFVQVISEDGKTSRDVFIKSFFTGHIVGGVELWDGSFLAQYKLPISDENHCYAVRVSKEAEIIWQGLLPDCDPNRMCIEHKDLFFIAIKGQELTAFRYEIQDKVIQPKTKKILIKRPALVNAFFNTDFQKGFYFSPFIVRSWSKPGGKRTGGGTGHIFGALGDFFSW